jgi:hypothetical protein
MQTPRPLRPDELAQLGQPETQAGTTGDEATGQQSTGAFIHGAMFFGGLGMLVFGFAIIHNNNATAVLGALSFVLLGCVCTVGGGYYLLGDIMLRFARRETAIDYTDVRVIDHNIIFARALGTHPIDDDSAAVIAVASIDKQKRYYYINTQDETLIADAELPGNDADEDGAVVIIPKHLAIVTLAPTDKDRKPGYTPLLITTTTHVTLQTHHLVAQRLTLPPTITEEAFAKLLLKALIPCPHNPYPPFHELNITKLPEEVRRGIEG